MAIKNKCLRKICIPALFLLATLILSLGAPSIPALFENTDCDCGVWGDMNGDGAINPVDVVILVNYVYKGMPIQWHPLNCESQVGDLNLDGVVNPIDVVLMVTRVYKGTGGPFPNPCESHSLIIPFPSMASEELML